MLLGSLITGGCAVTVPSSHPFSEALLKADGQNESVLLIYSMPDNAKHLYKYIFIDGEHTSTITTDTFFRIILEPGPHRVRVIQHGYKTPENWFVKYGKAKSILALQAATDIKLEPGAASFLSLGQGKRHVYSACAESETATKICGAEVTGLVIDEVPRETALTFLSSLREVCMNCE